MHEQYYSPSNIISLHNETFFQHHAHELSKNAFNNVRYLKFRHLSSSRSNGLMLQFANFCRQLNDANGEEFESFSHRSLLLPLQQIR